ncbi:GNAT family N-acetyltransferase, partial [Alkalibacterium iburiense]|uniref:GNAT family N-acetyltransferase n=1 Tax=Alkalibacterium iburiense TaxID=290589 RepID=UPI0031DB2200
KQKWPAFDKALKNPTALAVGVSTDYLGQRLAQKLLDKCIQVARKKGKKKVHIELDEFNERALAFFEKHDFEVVEGTSNNTVYMERVLS